MPARRTLQSYLHPLLQARHMILMIAGSLHVQLRRSSISFTLRSYGPTSIYLQSEWIHANHTVIVNLNLLSFLVILVKSQFSMSVPLRRLWEFMEIVIRIRILSPRLRYEESGVSLLLLE